MEKFFVTEELKDKLLSAGNNKKLVLRCNWDQLRIHDEIGRHLYNIVVPGMTPDTELEWSDNPETIRRTQTVATQKAVKEKIQVLYMDSKTVFQEIGDCTIVTIQLKDLEAALTDMYLQGLRAQPE